jgi:hypothetical protein
MLNKNNIIYRVILSLWIILITQTFLTHLSSFGSKEEISIEMYSEKANKAYIYINNDWVNPVIFDINKGIISNYVIPVSVNKVKNIRLDPSDGLEDIVKIYRFELLSNSRTLYNATLEEIYSWSYTNATQKHKAGDFIEIRGNSLTPMNINAAIPNYNINGILGLNFLNNKYYEKLISIIILSFIFFTNIKNIKILIILTSVMLFSINIFEHINSYFSTITNVNSTIGRSIINQGISSLGNQIGIVTIFLFSAIVGLLISNINKKNE